MLKGIVATLAAGAMAGIAGAAQAADLAVKAPVAVYDWSGIYVGGHVGYGWQTGAVDFGAANAFTADYFTAGWVPRSLSPGAQGVLGGLQIGANRQIGRYVFGIEADIALAALQGSTGASIDSFFISYPVTVVSTAESRLDALGTVRGRFGITPWVRSLLYVTGGLAYGRAEVASSITTIFTTNYGTAVFCGPDGLCASGTTASWRVGWTVGAGWEQALAGPWSVRLDYLYYDLGSLSHTFRDPALSAALFTASADVSGHIVRVGMNYRF